MKLYDLMEVIRDYDTEVDVVDSSETIIYKIKRAKGGVANTIIFANARLII